MMPKSLLLPANRCIPFKIAEYDSVSGSRIGGKHPEGILPPIVNPNTRYFLTLSFNDIELSVFLDLDYGFGDEDSVPYLRGDVIDESKSFVQLIIHPRQSRSRAAMVGSDLSSAAICLSEEVDETDEGVFNHKIGGKPFFNWDEDLMVLRMNALYAEGFSQLFQINSRSKWDGPIGGDWPFGEYTFHVFAKELAGSFTFRYSWG